MLGYASALRGSELVALTLDDLETKPAGLLLTVRQSRTNQEGHGQVVAVAHGTHATTDPVAALAAWLQQRGTQPGALFTRIWASHISDQPLGNHAVAGMLRHRAVATGLDGTRITAHSLRAGHATTAAMAASRSPASPPSGSDVVVVFRTGAERVDGLGDDGMGQFARWMQLAKMTIGQRAAWLRGVPLRVQVLLQHAERGASATAVHVAILPNGADGDRQPARMSEQVGDLVVRGSSRLALVSEALGKLTTIALVLLFELNEVAQADTTIATDTVEGDLATIEQLVEVSAAHTEALGALARCDRLVAVNDDDFVASAHAAAQAQQQITQLGASIRAGELVERVELLGRDLGGLKSLHRGSSSCVTDDVDVTDESSVRRASGQRGWVSDCALITMAL